MRRCEREGQSTIAHWWFIHVPAFFVHGVRKLSVPEQNREQRRYQQYVL